MAEEEKKPSFYDTLGVAVDATKAEIKKAFKRKASKAHPDREGGDKETFQALQKAYAILSDDRSRQKYDTDGNEGGDYVPTPFELAMQNLSMLFTSIITENLDNIETVDIIKTIEENVKKNRMPQQAIIKKMEKKLAKLANAKAKLKRKRKKRKDGPDLFEHIIGTQEQDANRNITTAKEQLEMMDMMLEMAHEYEYDFDQPDHVTATERQQQMGWKPPAGFDGGRTGTGY